VKINEDTPILSVTRMFTRDCSFWQYKVYSDICYGCWFVAQGGVN